MARPTNDKNINEQEAKQRILNAAREVFSERGYTGASISEIAKRANVNKALPYYYFENKKEILEELVKAHVQLIFAKREASINRAGSINKESIDYFYERFFNFEKEGKEYLKILVTEIIKDSPDSLEVFKLLSPAFDEMVPEMKKSGLYVEDEIGLKVRAFFLSFMPLVMFQVLGEKWAEYYGVDREEVRRKFADAFKDTYIRRIHSLFFEGKNESGK